MAVSLSVQDASSSRKMTGANSVALSSTPLKYTQAAKVGGGDLQALFDVQYV